MKMPVLFVGHGSPMNAIEDNTWSRAFEQLGRDIPKPRAILAISAHWFVPGIYLTANERPRTIHDFGGFPRALHEIQYPAPGKPDLARQVSHLLSRGEEGLSTDWGLDHGTWSVLRRMWPGANHPVVQLSIDSRLPASRHIDLSRALEPLRDEGVLIFASGNITHNLRHAFGAMRSGEESVPAWSSRFDTDVAKALDQHDVAFLTRALESDDGRLSHPTPDHYLPLLYAAGAANAHDNTQFPIEGFDHGLSMRAVRFG